MACLLCPFGPVLFVEYTQNALGDNYMLGRIGFFHIAEREWRRVVLNTGTGVRLRPRIMANTMPV